MEAPKLDEPSTGPQSDQRLFTSDNRLPLEAVISTAELHRRESRPADYEAENRALAALMQEMASSSGKVLQKLVESALSLCGAHSAGISILEEEDGRKIFRWHAVAGQWSVYLGGTMPREISPCGTVLDRNSALLMSHPERHYPFPPDIAPPVVEVLLIPFYVADEPVGTIWVIAHDESRQFDREDERLMTSLGKFASTAYQLLASQDEGAQAEAALRESEQRYRQLVDGLPAAVYTCDAQGRITLYNDAAVALWGREPELGRDLWCGSWRIYRRDGTPLPLEECPMAVALKEGRPVFGEEIVIERPDGTRRNVLPYPEPMRDASGALLGAVNTLVDITEVKRADQALRESEERLRLAARASNDVIWEIDLNEDRVWWSEAMQTVFGYALDDIGPDTSWCHEHIHPDDRDRVVHGMADVINGPDEVWSDEFRYRRANGSYAYVVDRAYVVRDSKGKAVRMIGAMRDITARKQAEEVSARLAAIVDSSDDAIVGKTLEGIITSWNSAAERIFGYTAVEAMGQHISLIIPDERQAEEDDVLARLRHGERIDHFETERQTKDGRRIQISLTVSPIKNAEGRIIGASKVARDITAHKQAEEKLRYQQQLLRTITDNAQTSIFMMDTEGRGTFVNPAVEKMTGYRKEELIGHFLHGILHPIHPDGSPYPIIECPVHRVLPLNEPVRGHEDAFVRKDGTFIPVRCNARPIVKDEVPTGTIIEVWDITLEKWAEQALRESEAHFRNMADNAPAMLWVTDPTARCTYLSKQWYEYTGNRPEQDLGFGWLKNVHPDDVQAASDTFLKANQQHVPFSLDYRLRRHDGEYRWVVNRGLPRLDPGGSFEGYVGCVVDVHERKLYEQALAEARKAADAANRSKSEFLANMSHEIRSPMTGILGYSDILLNHLKDPDDIECVKTIKQSGNYLLELINDILDLSKIEAGELKIGNEPISLPTLLTEVHSLMSVRAKEKSLPLVLKYQGPIPESIESDRTRLRQILINLISNAIKFTENGSVQIIAKFLPDQSVLQIEVADTGIGIAREQQQRLFQPFTQGDSSVTRQYGGTGLGLAITKRLVEMLGGTISFESEQNKGSSFRVVIPVKIVGTTSRGLGAVWSVPDVRLNCHVLVTDDRREIRDLVRHFIEDAGGRVSAAENGQAAIEAIERSEANGQPFDIVIMDIQMPGLDGYEATRRLRAKGFGKPIIGLTAGAMKGDREKCLEAGCDDYLSKPVDRRALVELVAYYSGASGDGKKDRYAQVSEKSKVKILLVDDSQLACRATAVLLEMSGHEVRTACDGQSALAIAQDFSADVAIVDIKLPDIDGYRLVRRLKELNGFQDAKFIALTGYEEEALAKDAAVVFHHLIRKPVDVALLESLLVSEKSQ